jgi:four helix bundle protein
MRVFAWTKGLPRVEERALVEQVRRSSRAVGANIAEAWRRRRYPRAFVRSLTDAEAEAEETRHWLRVALHCGYLTAGAHKELDDAYDALLGLLVRMVATAPRWSPGLPGHPNTPRPTPRPPVSPSPSRGGEGRWGSPRRGGEAGWGSAEP